MSFLNLFGSEPPRTSAVRLPREYRRAPRWTPLIGDIFPDFAAPTTHGPIAFHAWAERSWTILFSQPGAFTPVCTTELAGFARAAPAFAQRGARLIGLTPDSVEDLDRWRLDVGRMYETEVNIPMVADLDGRLAEIFGMHHPRDSGPVPIRKTFLIDPALTIRMILDYPARIGRSTTEMLRLLDAFRAEDRLGVATPCD